MRFARLSAGPLDDAKIMGASESAWEPFLAGATIGKLGTESGVILRDEEYAEAARITLERPEPQKPFRQPVIRFAITCGVYGWMVHTRFFSTEEAAVGAYEAMKPELARIAEGLPEVSPSDPELDAKITTVASELDSFTDRFP